MQKEIIAFRLTLTVTVLALLFGGGVGLHENYDAKGWQAAVESEYREMNRVFANCEKTPPVGICEADWVQGYRDRFEATAEARDSHKRRGGLAISLAWKIPLGALATFYVLRWVVLGRFTPAWPLRRA